MNNLRHSQRLGANEQQRPGSAACVTECSTAAAITDQHPSGSFAPGAKLTGQDDASESRPSLGSAIHGIRKPSRKRATHQNERCGALAKLWRRCKPGMVREVDFASSVATVKLLTTFVYRYGGRVYRVEDIKTGHQDVVGIEYLRRVGKRAATERATATTNSTIAPVVESSPKLPSEGGLCVSGADGQAKSAAPPKIARLSDEPPKTQQPLVG